MVSCQSFKKLEKLCEATFQTLDNRKQRTGHWAGEPRWPYHCPAFPGLSALDRIAGGGAWAEQRSLAELRRQRLVLNGTGVFWVFKAEYQEERRYAGKAFPEICLHIPLCPLLNTKQFPKLAWEQETFNFHPAIVESPHRELQTFTRVSGSYTLHGISKLAWQ